jgi:uncharacterized protein YbjT (DUF2867 family)
MKYVITGSLGNVSKPLSEKLLAGGHDVTIITSNANKIKTIEKLGAAAAVGSVEDVQFLTDTFKDADAVYTMIPPKWDAINWKEWIAGTGANYSRAIKETDVRYVVNLSSMGAHMPAGCGPVSGLYHVEESLNSLESVNIKHLRPAYFYHNFMAQFDMIKHAGIMGANFGDNPVPIVHPADVAEAAAEELLNLAFTGHRVRYIVGDECTGAEISKIIGEAISKPNLPWVVFSDEQNLEGAMQAGLSAEVAKNYTEMGKAIRTGEMTEDYYRNKSVPSKIKFQDFAPEFAAAFNA